MDVLCMVEVRVSVVPLEPAADPLGDAVCAPPPDAVFDPPLGAACDPPLDDPCDAPLDDPDEDGAGADPPSSLSPSSSLSEPPPPGPPRELVWALAMLACCPSRPLITDSICDPSPMAPGG